MSFLKGFGRYLPERIVSNHELGPQLGESPEWIVSHCGIDQRRYAAANQTVADLGVAAAEDCLAKAALEPREIGFLIVSSGSPDVFCPGPASEIAFRLGLGGTPAIDLPIASAGSIAALALADSLAGRFGKVLIVATEIMSRRIERSPAGKDAAILFGDGAGAAIVSPSEGFARIAAVALHSNGEKAQAIRVTEGRFAMEGITVIRLASQYLPAVIEEALERASVAAASVGALLIHQANLKLLERVAKALLVPRERLFTNIERYGNTSSASLLIAAAEWHEANRTIQAPLVLASFGSGLTYGALVATPPGV
jgi:3-oxoacyl-[acyl-carrier-protein] synthase-3